MPNLIHSLDAASIAILVNLLFKENEYISIYTIHDCFAVPTNLVDSLYSQLKLAYLTIYSSDNFLENFDTRIRELIKSSYGENSFNENTLKILINDTEISYPDINTIFIINDNKSKIKINIKDKLQNSSYLIS